MRARLSLTAALLACALAGAAPALAEVRGHAGHRPDGGPARSERPVHSSDGAPGPIAPPLPAGLRRVPTRTNEVSWQVAPGVQFDRWDQTDARGPIRANLLTIDPAEPGITIDFADSGRVRRTAPVPRILARDAAIAGVNGDFYDIKDTGAPLGIGRDRQRGLLHAPRWGWNAAFYLDRHGVPGIAKIPMLARIAQHPGFHVTNVNSPHVKIGGIGVYTPVWGSAAGYRVTDGQRRHVRQVVIRGGRVRSNRTRLEHGDPVRGLLLVGRGRGARELARLRVGSRATVSWHLVGRPPVAISGSQILLADGVRRVDDDREMHPRTAVGIDRDTGHVLMLVVDGRQEFSRGYTMVELANLMAELGAEDALNLDGGGSSTMVARRPNGKVGVVNSPSDGFLRWVADALEVTYTPPPG